MFSLYKRHDCPVVLPKTIWILRKTNQVVQKKHQFTFEHNIWIWCLPTCCKIAAFPRQKTSKKREFSAQKLAIHRTCCGLRALSQTAWCLPRTFPRKLPQRTATRRRIWWVPENGFQMGLVPENLVFMPIIWHFQEKNDKICLINDQICIKYEF